MLMLLFDLLCVHVLKLSEAQSRSDSCGSVLLYQCSTESNLGCKPLSRPNLFRCFLWKQWPLSLVGLGFSFFFPLFFGLIHYFPMILFWYKSIFFYCLRNVYVSDCRINTIKGTFRNVRFFSTCKLINVPKFIKMSSWFLKWLLFCLGITFLE